MVQLLHGAQSNNRINADLKLPPHSIEAEQSTIGGLMLLDAAWDIICERVSEEDFYRQDHRLIFRAIAALANVGKPRDVVTLSEWLEQRGELEKAGGLLYLGTLAKDTPSAANIKAYADIVRERSVLRQLIQVGEEIAGEAYSPGEQEVSQLLDEAESKVFRIAEQVKGGSKKNGYVGIRTVLGEAVDRIDERYHSKNPITGIPTGFDALDERTRGLQKTDLIIIAGRPGMGKSVLMMNIVENAAIRHKKACAVFSLEMSRSQLGERSIASLGRIDFERLQNGQLEDSDWPRITTAISMMSEARLFIDDTSGLTIPNLKARCRRIRREHGLDLIAVDYIQLMEAVDKKQNYSNQIGEISRGLKGIAKEFDVPVVALSQLNRAVDSRSDKRPTMSDLRDSGAIEQDADIIICPYRDVVYNEETKYPHTAELLIRKFRNGKTGRDFVSSIFKYMKFENSAPEHYEGYEQYINTGKYDKKGGMD
jgi:replicative DNA helicase